MPNHKQPETPEPENIIKSVPVEERALLLTTQINEMQAELNAKDAAEQTEAELDEIAKLYKEIEELFELKKERQMEFKHYGNNKTVEVTDELEKDGLKVGQRFRKKPGEEFQSEEISNAKELKVVGFRKDESTVVAQIDGGEVGDWRTDLFKELFDPIEEQPERQMRFEAVSNEDIYLTDELAYMHFKVGQKALIKPGQEKNFHSDIVESKEFTIVGFTNDKDTIVLQISGGVDEGKAICQTPNSFDTNFEIIESKKERQMEFEGYGLEKVKVTGEQEKFGFEVGQRMKLKASAKHNKGKEIRDAKDLTVVGFTDKNIAIQVDGNKVVLDPNGFNSFEPF